MAGVFDGTRLEQVQRTGQIISEQCLANLRRDPGPEVEFRGSGLRGLREGRRDQQSADPNAEEQRGERTTEWWESVA